MCILEEVRAQPDFKKKSLILHCPINKKGLNSKNVEVKFFTPNLICVKFVRNSMPGSRSILKASYSKLKVYGLILEFEGHVSDYCCA